MKATARSQSWVGVALLGALGAGVFLLLMLFAYELARARVPQHRAALERLVRAQTGLDVRFTELGLRWGWYGPEAVFRQVELDEPGSAEALLRAPELVVGFDAWRTLRSGHPEAGRIELIAPEIDFSGVAGRRGVGAQRPGVTAASAETSAIGRVAVLQRWRGGRIDIEGGTLRLPPAAGSANLFNYVQIRRASLRRSDDEWSVAGLVFLPDRVGRSARITLSVTGDLGKPAELNGKVRVEARRLLFPGSRDFLAAVPDLARYLPRGGNGDLTMDLSFERGALVKASGNVRAGGLVFDGTTSVEADAGTVAGGFAVAGSVGAGAAAGRVAPSGNEAGASRANLLVMDRLRGDWRATRRGSGWRIRVDSLDLVKGEPLGALTFDTSDSAVQAAPGRWIRGKLEQAPLASVLAVARWLAPHFDLAGIQLDGTARTVAFDWAAGRPAGQRLQTAARLDDVALVPRSKDFTLSGLGARVSGTESQLTIDVQSRIARLELAQSLQQPLTDVHVASTLRVSSGRDGWQIATDEFLLEHQRAGLILSGSLQDDPIEPRIEATGKLVGADIPLVMRLLGENTAQAFGAAASRLTAGRIQNADFALRGPIGKLPFEGGGEGFTGSLTLRNAVLSGGDLWPDAEEINARVEWRGARIQATIEAGHAGAFQLTAAKAQWAADGSKATRLTGHVNGRLEDAIAWVQDHPGLQEYVPDMRYVDARGEASFDFNISVPASLATDVHQPRALARVSTFIDGATVEAVSGLPPLESVTGSVVFDLGRLQRSALTASWLGGPVTLRVGERREKGQRVLAIQAQGTLTAQRLATLANASGTVEGNTDWTGELAYVQTADAQEPHWRMRADSNLLGVVSSLPEPFTKRSAAAAVPVHLEVAGANDVAHLRADLGDRVRSSFALKRSPDLGWMVDRGAMRFGTVVPTLPSQRIVLVRGRLNQLDLPAYAVAWTRLRWDSLPTIRAQMVADEMLVGGRRYAEVSLQAERTGAGTDLLIDSAGVAGMARWPKPPDPTQGRGYAPEVQPAELHLTRLDLPDGTLSGEGIGLIAALAPNALLSVDELNWQGRSLGRLTATVSAEDKLVVVDDIRLVNGTQDSHGVLRCQTGAPTCHLSFVVDSSNASATLADFGFKPDVVASGASLKGDVEWHPATDWVGSLRGTVAMRLTDGSLYGSRRVAEIDTESAHPADIHPGDAHASDAQPADAHQADAYRADAPPFGLLAVPALVSGLDVPGAAAAPLTKEQHELHFSRLEADFELHDGQATTSNLHFDGDAEILMRGRVGLVSRDYDQQVWVLRGEERLPAAVRRFGATPRVAAAWLSLRDLFAGSGAQDRSRAVLRLQGSWDDPMVVAAN
ncbi:MAG: YhdP family protein [Steroidobacteraceae bacterium]